jgi:hypothetical protein
MFISNIFEFMITNELNIIVILITVFLILICSLFLPQSLYDLFKRNKFIRNLDIRSNLFISYVSILLLFLFGISLIVNITLFDFSIFKCIVGISLILIFIYFNYYIFTFKETVLEVMDVSIEDNLNCITFIDDKDNLIEYYTKDINIKSDTHYKVLYNKNTRWVKKIIGIVSVIE